MEILYTQCCGLDVHKRQVTACRLWREPRGQSQQEVREFGTFTADLRELAQWLRQHGVQQVAMEATGSYWRPVWNVLEAEGLPQILANARNIKAVPGRKTDIKDAQWLADLLQHGLAPASFVPGQKMRHLRDLTRMRVKIIQDHTRVINRIGAVLEDANIKLGSVVSDLQGVSAQAMIRGLLGGSQSPAELAELARGRMRLKRAQLQPALEGHLRRPQRFLLNRLLIQARFLEQQQQMLSREIGRQLDQPAREVMALWDTIPGVDTWIATVMVAEMGTRPEQFPDAHHAASWAALCPGNHESAGKRRSGKTRKGNRWLRAAFSQAARAAEHSKGSYLSALFRRIAARRGRKRAKWFGYKVTLIPMPAAR